MNSTVNKLQAVQKSSTRIIFSFAFLGLAYLSFDNNFTGAAVFFAIFAIGMAVEAYRNTQREIVRGKFRNNDSSS